MSSEKKANALQPACIKVRPLLTLVISTRRCSLGSSVGRLSRLIAINQTLIFRFLRTQQMVQGINGKPCVHGETCKRRLRWEFGGNSKSLHLIDPHPLSQTKLWGLMHHPRYSFYQLKIPKTSIRLRLVDPTKARIQYWSAMEADTGDFSESIPKEREIICWRNSDESVQS